KFTPERPSGLTFRVRAVAQPISAATTVHDPLRPDNPTWAGRTTARYTQTTGKPIGSPGMTEDPVRRHCSRTSVRSMTPEPVNATSCASTTAPRDSGTHTDTGSAEAVAGAKTTADTTPTAAMNFDTIRGIFAAFRPSTPTNRPNPGAWSSVALTSSALRRN